MRYSERVIIRSFPALGAALLRRAEAEGHGNVSVVARTILVRELKVKLPRKANHTRKAVLAKSLIARRANPTRRA